MKKGAVALRTFSFATARFCYRKTAPDNREICMCGAVFVIKSTYAERLL